MKLIHKPDDLINGNRKACLAIGMFDGVHLGHQQVLRQAIQDSHRHEARSVAVTFDRHPATVIAPGRAPALLQTRAQRLRTIESQGIDAALLIKFDKAFSRKPGAEFVQELADGFGTIHSICVGVNFAFGHKRDGNVDLLRTLGQALGFHVPGLRAVSLDGQAVSSTRSSSSVSLYQRPTKRYHSSNSSKQTVPFASLSIAASASVTSSSPSSGSPSNCSSAFLTSPRSRTPEESVSSPSNRRRRLRVSDSAAAGECILGMCTRRAERLWPL